MTAVFRSPAVLPALLLLAACTDDPADPCAEVGCGVAGVELALVQADIDWSEAQGFDERVGARVSEPGEPMTYRFRVLNRGTETSEPTTLDVGSFGGWTALGTPIGIETIEIPALDPGESFSGRHVIETPMPPGLGSADMAAEFWLGGIFGGYFDADNTNHRARFPYHVATGFGRIGVDVRDGDTLRVGQADSVWLSVSNQSQIAALEGDLHLAFCAASLYETEVTCASNAFGALPLDDMGPRGGESLALELMIPPDALSLFDIDVIGLRACLVDGTAETAEELTYLMGSGVCSVTAVPFLHDLDAACDPETVSLPATLDASAAASHCGDTFADFDVWAFETEEAGLHTIEVVTGAAREIRIHGADYEEIKIAESGAFYVPDAGRYHVVVLSELATPTLELD